MVVTEGATATEADLQAWVRANVRSSKMPSHVAFLEVLPHNDTGKLLRRVLESSLAEEYES